MLSRGVDVGFPSEIVISLVVFIRFLVLNVYFHLLRVFLHSFFEILRITALLTLNFSCCTKISPDHVTVTSHSKWRLTMNFLKNSHSFSKYSIFTYSFALLLCLLLCTLFSEQYFFSSVTKFKYLCFLCQLTCQSADIMSSLCGVGVRVRVNNFSSKTTRPRDVLFFLKDTLSIEDEKLFKACKSVCSSVC